MMVVDRGITIHQPYASLIALGVKRFETRSRPTGYRGPVMIHAGKADPAWGISIGRYFISSGPKLARFGGGLDGEHPLPLGAVVAVADIVDSLPIVVGADEWGVWPENTPDAPYISADSDDPKYDTSVDGLTHWRPDTQWKGSGSSAYGKHIDDQLPYGDWTPGRWAHQLANVIPLDEPVPCRGSQAYPWRADQATIDAVNSQIGGA